MAILLPSLKALFEKEFNCHNCINKYSNTPRGEQRSIARRKQKGCFDYTSRTYELEDYKYFTCLGNFNDSYVRYYWELYLKYKEGMLPYKGSIQQQPNKIIEIFGILEESLERTRDKKKGKGELTEEQLQKQVNKLKAQGKKVKRKIKVGN